MTTNRPLQAALASDVADDVEELVDLLAAVARTVLRRRQVEPLGAAPPEPWITIEDAARYAAVSEDTIRSWIKSDRLRVGRVGQVIRVRASDIDRLLMTEAANDTETSGGTTDRAREIINSMGKG